MDLICSALTKSKQAKPSVDFYSIKENNSSQNSMQHIEQLHGFSETKSYNANDMIPHIIQVKKLVEALNKN